jgi:hypothetical protein
MLYRFQLIIRNPFTLVARFSWVGWIDEVLQALAHVGNHIIDMGLQCKHPSQGIIFRDGPLHLRVQLGIALAEDIVNDFAVVFDATAMIKLGLSQVMVNTSNYQLGRTHLQILRIDIVNRLDQLGDIQVEHIGTNAHHRAVLLMQFVDDHMVLSLTNI